MGYIITVKLTSKFLKLQKLDMFVSFLSLFKLLKLYILYTRWKDIHNQSLRQVIEFNNNLKSMIKPNKNK